jgi:hypothetical protein
MRPERVESPKPPRLRVRGRQPVVAGGRRGVRRDGSGVGGRPSRRGPVRRPPLAPAQPRRGGWGAVPSRQAPWRPPPGLADKRARDVARPGRHVHRAGPGPHHPDRPGQRGAGPAVPLGPSPPAARGAVGRPLAAPPPDHPRTTARADHPGPPRWLVRAAPAGRRELSFGVVLWAGRVVQDRRTGHPRRPGMARPR